VVANFICFSESSTPPLSSKTASSANREYGKLLFLLQGCPKIARFHQVAQNLSDLAAIQNFQKRSFRPDQHLRTSLRCGTILDEALTVAPGRDMRLITAIIKPFKLDEVREALSALGVQASVARRATPKSIAARNMP
jgi:hypothetical protein